VAVLRVSLRARGGGRRNSKLIDDDGKGLERSVRPRLDRAGLEQDDVSVAVADMTSSDSHGTRISTARSVMEAMPIAAAPASSSTQAVRVPDVLLEESQRDLEGPPNGAAEGDAAILRTLSLFDDRLTMAVEHSVRGDIGTPLRTAPPGGSNAATAGSNAPTVADTKFGSEVPTMVFGNKSAYRDGLLSRTGQPTRSVRQEFARNDHGRWLPELEYVAERATVPQYPDSKGPAPNPEQEPAYTRDLGHDGKRLDDFWREQPARGTKNELSRAEVTVLRLYTGPWFTVINFYLRYLPVVECCTSTPYHVDESTLKAYDVRRFFLESASESDTCWQCGKPRLEHYRQPVDSWATSAALLYCGIVKLTRKTTNAMVYRGVKEKYVRLPDEFVQPTDASRGVAGGVELGAMSTTTDKQVALSYMCENGTDADCALFEIPLSAVSCGADLSFLSQYSAERELLFPPGTSLTCRSVEITKPGQRELVLDAQFHPDTKLREVVVPIHSLDYQPLDPLLAILKPLNFGAEFKEYGTRFVPGTRRWVFKAIDEWLADDGTSRCRVLLGGPGFGKTAIVARLCESRRDAVVGVHLCRHTTTDTSVIRDEWCAPSPTRSPMRSRSTALR